MTDLRIEDINLKIERQTALFGKAQIYIEIDTTYIHIKKVITSEEWEKFKEIIKGI